MNRTALNWVRSDLGPFRPDLMSLQLYFCGAEVSSHLNILRECGVERVAINVSNLARGGKTDLTKWASKDRLDGMEWILYADSQTVPASFAMEILDGAQVAPEGVIGPARLV